MESFVKGLIMARMRPENMLSIHQHECVNGSSTTTQLIAIMEV